MGSKPKFYKTAFYAVLIVGLLVGAVWFSIHSGFISVASTKEGRALDEPVAIAASGLPKGVTSDNFGKAGTLSLAAFDQESATKAQVAATAYVWRKEFDASAGKYADEWTYLGTTTLNASARASFTGVNVGDKVRVIAFDSTYPYGEKQEFVISQTSATLNLKVQKGTTSQTITFFDQNDNAITNPTTTGNISMSTTQYKLSRVRIENADDYSSWQPYIVGFDAPSSSNISELRMSGATAYTQKIKRFDSLDYVFQFQPGNLNNDVTYVDTGAVTIVPDGDAITSETVTVYVIDLAPFLDNDNQLQYGVQNAAINAADVGIADKSQGILFS
jgi:hypothetical protein